MENRRLGSFNWATAVSVGVLILMIAASVTFPLFAEPYEGSRQHVIIHESSADFDRIAERHDISTTDPTPLNELSPVAQRIVTDAVAEADGRTQYRYDAKFCQDDLPRCDGYEKHPPDFDYVGQGEYPERYEVVEVDGEVYIVDLGQSSTGAVDWGEIRQGAVPTLFVFVPTVGLLTLTTAKARESHPTLALTVAAYGLLVTVVGVLTPYLEMFYNIPFEQYGTVLFLSTLLLSIAVPAKMIRDR